MANSNIARKVAVHYNGRLLKTTAKPNTAKEVITANITDKDTCGAKPGDKQNCVVAHVIARHPKFKKSIMIQVGNRRVTVYRINGDIERYDIDSATRRAIKVFDNGESDASFGVSKFTLTPTPNDTLANNRASARRNFEKNKKTKSRTRNLTLLRSTEERDRIKEQKWSTRTIRWRELQKNKEAVFS